MKKRKYGYNHKFKIWEVVDGDKWVLLILLFKVFVYIGDGL